MIVDNSHVIAGTGGVTRSLPQNPRVQRRTAGILREVCHPHGCSHTQRISISSLSLIAVLKINNNGYWLQS